MKKKDIIAWLDKFDDEDDFVFSLGNDLLDRVARAKIILDDWDKLNFTDGKDYCSQLTITNASYRLGEKIILHLEPKEFREEFCRLYLNPKSDVKKA